MNELLQRAVADHGGLERFDQFRHVSAEVSIGGALWSLNRLTGIGPLWLVEHRLY